MSEIVVGDLLACLCVLLTVTVLASVLITAGRTFARRRSLRRYLSSDWWAGFERDLRAYERGRSHVTRQRPPDD